MIVLYLVDSQAWNHICENIFGKITKYKSITDSSNWGSYANTDPNPMVTGFKNDYNNYNIYDMAGNLWKWTTGHNINPSSETLFSVGRGRWLAS